MRTAAVNPESTQPQSVWAQHLIVLVGLAAGGTLLLAGILSPGTQGVDSTVFFGLLLLYAAASCAFLISRIRGGHLPFFDIPVFLTALGLVRFGVVPVLVLLHPDIRNPYLPRMDYRELIRTLLLFVPGMVAFWVGCYVFRPRIKEVRASVSTTTEERSQVPLGWAVGIFVVSLACRAYLARNYGWGYGMDWDTYFDNLALMQVLGNVSGLGTIALVVICIEMCHDPRSQLRRILFVIIFMNEVLWGALSGSKIGVFGNFLVVAAIVSLKGAKFEKKWVTAVLVGFVLFYPIQDRYRSLLRSGSVDATRVGALAQAGNAAAMETARQESGAGGWIRTGWSETLDRLDLLQTMTVTVSLDAWQVSQVQGEERWWMVPFYPFVPRSLWQSKPLLVRPQRLSVILGLPATTATALTYPGDLYMDYGVPGLLIGMFAFGMCWQLITNRVVQRPGKGDLFVYAGFFVFAINAFETDAFSVWVSFIRLWATLSVMAYLIYGSRRRQSPVQADPDGLDTGNPGIRLGHRKATAPEGARSPGLPT